MFLLLIIPFNQHILLSILGSLILFSSFPPAKRIGPTSSWDDICEKKKKTDRSLISSFDAYTQKRH